MNEEKKDNYLNIEIPEELGDQLSNIQVTPEFDIILEVNGNTVIGSIEFKKANKKEVLDWKKTTEKIMTKLKEQEIDYKLLTKIHLLLSKSSDKFKEYVESANIQKDKNIDDSSNDKMKLRMSKYYSKNEQRIYESVVLEGISYFVSYDNDIDELIITEEIEENTRILIPYDRENDPAIPYQFDSKDHLHESIRKSKSTVTIGSLYREIKRIISKYVDQKPAVLNIISVDILFSYFQDRFPTTHYLFFTGDNNVGKSVIGEAFEQLSYRAVKMTDPSPPNIFRLLGKEEPAQHTIIMDEANDIDNNKEIMNVIKTGYNISGKVPKINTHFNNIQEFFKTYSLKVFLAERIPSNYKAKGVLDRSFCINCLVGTKHMNIKDLLIPQGKHGNGQIKKLQEEITSLRNSLFVYRLLHVYDKRPDLDIGLKNRDRELCECITLFYGSEVQKEVEETFQELLNSKYEQKENSFDARLLFLILENLGNSEVFGEIFVEDLWNSIKNTLNNEEINSNEIFLIDYNYKLFRNQISNRCQIFGGKSKHTNKGNKIIFNDIDKLRQIFDSYSNENRPIIRSSIRNSRSEGSEGCEGSEGFRERRDEFIEEDGRKVEIRR